MDNRINRSISEVVKYKLCCSCGACYYACPQDDISFHETVGGNLFPEIDITKCTNCGICKNICPGNNLDTNLIDKLSCDPFTGSALQIFVGKATDESIYKNSQSGGIVSALLIHALNTNRIGGAITSVMVSGNPPKVVPKLAKSIEEIKQAQKSKYCPVPLLSILNEIEELEKPVAVVGVACQMHGLLNILEQYPRLKEKISFTIGLICSHTMTYGAIDYLLKKANGSIDTSKILHYKDKTCGGYPGNVNIIYSNDHTVSMTASTRMKIKDFFTPARCRLCFDKMNIFSDITVGDPWGIDGVDRKGGESVAIIRTEKGMDIFQDAVKDNAVNVRKISYDEALAGQNIEKKRIDWRGYIEAWNNLGYPVPDYFEHIRKYTQSNHQNARYKKQLQHAFSLEKYPSRKALIAAAEKEMFYQSIKRKVTWPLRAMKRFFGKL